MVGQLVPDTQAAPLFTGSFIADGGGGGGPLGPFLALAPGFGMTMGVTGSVGYIGGAFLNRPPLAWGGRQTVGMIYTANLAGGVFEGVSGCFCTLEVQEKRDYLVAVTLWWRWASANWAYEWVRISANGSATGILPPYWTKQQDANPNTTEEDTRTFLFLLKDWEPGTYVLQVEHSPAGSDQNREINEGLIVVF
jgi:hypothetical protein